MRVKFHKGPWHGVVKWLSPDQIANGVWVAVSPRIPFYTGDMGMTALTPTKRLYKVKFNTVQIGNTTYTVPATDPNGTLYLVCED